MYCSLDEAWAPPVRVLYPDDTRVPTYNNDVQNLQSYTNCYHTQPNAPVDVPQAPTPAAAKEGSAPAPVPAVAEYAPDFTQQKNTQIINALLYIISGIYFLYALDLIMRTGAYLRLRAP